MDGFDFKAPAELFASPGKGASRRPMEYRRFRTSAEAVRYAIEDLPEPMLRGAVLEVNGERFDGDQIRALYNSSDFPLARA
jgi:hypothetical protein